ncbi:substrate-binding domain-containing protein, partial [uncultured Microbacterium sp.]|uniref:substrate-binding domain-containing protein n=1 Tax=uncultured Microbacterium sp. TaxID=191216 RepID=UPI00261089D6
LAIPQILASPASCWNQRVQDQGSSPGFDDSPWATRVTPKLSTVHQDSELTGERMALTLLRLISGEVLPGYREYLTTEIVWRDSA